MCNHDYALAGVEGHRQSDYMDCSFNTFVVVVVVGVIVVLDVVVVFYSFALKLLPYLF